MEIIESKPRRHYCFFYNSHRFKEFLARKEPPRERHDNCLFAFAIRLFLVNDPAPSRLGTGDPLT
jgi:hypothetical protein